MDGELSEWLCSVHFGFGGRLCLVAKDLSLLLTTSEIVQSQAGIDLVELAVSDSSYTACIVCFEKLPLLENLPLLGDTP